MPRVPGTGVISHDTGLLEHGSHHSNPLKIAVKISSELKNFFACGALKGASPRGQPRIGHPGRHHHPRQSVSGSHNPGRRNRRVTQLSVTDVDSWRPISPTRTSSRRTHARSQTCVSFQNVSLRVQTCVTIRELTRYPTRKVHGVPWQPATQPYPLGPRVRQAPAAAGQARWRGERASLDPVRRCGRSPRGVGAA